MAVNRAGRVKIAGDTWESDGSQQGWKSEGSQGHFGECWQLKQMKE